MARSRAIDLFDEGCKATNLLENITAEASPSDMDNIITEGVTILSEQSNETVATCAVIHSNPPSLCCSYPLGSTGGNMSGQNCLHIS